jgi:hypothetical protein
MDTIMVGGLKEEHSLLAWLAGVLFEDTIKAEGGKALDCIIVQHIVQHPRTST